MVRERAISSVLIAGGGIVAWSAAAALRRHLPMIEVTVVSSPPTPAALADRLGLTLPSIVEFHHDLGLTEADTVVRAGSSYRLGTNFEGWAEQRPDYIHAYGDYGRPSGGTAFYQQWLRAARDRTAAPFHAFSVSAMMAANGRFAHPGAVAQLAAGYAYALHIDPASYGDMMRAFALHLGASERRGKIADVTLRPGDGSIDSLALDDGGQLAADLYVDATGPEALIRGQMGAEWDDWSEYLIADRVLFADGPATTDAGVLDRAIAVDAGWRWQAASRGRNSNGLVYSSRHLTDSEAETLLRTAAGADPAEGPITVRPGRLAQPWLRNCVAIGDAAVGIEPLEWTNLHLAHSAIDRLVAMIPDCDFSPVELWDYNRQAAAESDRVRDFVVLHYAVADRSGDFWNEARGRPLPASLQHTLTQFRERGRLPFYEEETFARDSWLAVLLGQGMIPRRLDPLLDTIPEEESRRAMEQMKSAIAASVRPLASQTDYLRAMAGQTA